MTIILKESLIHPGKIKRGPFDGMDRVEEIDRDRAGDRLGERDARTQRVSEIETEVETERKVSAMLKDYDVCGSDRDDERSPPKLELVSGYRQPHHSLPNPISQPQPPYPSHPLFTMDTSNVRFRPVSVMAQAEMTSTYGHPRLNWPEKARVNTIILFLILSDGFFQRDYSLLFLL